MVSTPMTAYAPHSAHHKKRRDRFTKSAPTKALVRMHRKPQFIDLGALTSAQLRALHAIGQEAI